VGAPEHLGVAIFRQRRSASIHSRPWDAHLSASAMAAHLLLPWNDGGRTHLFASRDAIRAALTPTYALRCFASEGTSAPTHVGSPSLRPRHPKQVPAANRNNSQSCSV